MDDQSRDYTPSPRKLPLSNSAPSTPQLATRWPNIRGRSKEGDEGGCWPPVLPDKPVSKLASSNPPSNSSIELSSDQETPLNKGPFSLSEFVSKCSRSLPLCVKVENGFHSDDESQSIGVGEIYNIHLVKHSKVVELKDPNDTTYHFPLSSSVEFAPVFNEADEEQTSPERYYDRVTDVISIKPLPKLLRATKSYSLKDGSLLVEKNEILVVQKVITSVLRRPKSLQVYSIKHQKEKTLPGDCEGRFTDDSYATRLHLPDIVTFFFNEFPLYVRAYLTDIEQAEGCDFPHHLSSVVSEMTGMKTETSLVASTYNQLPTPAGIDDEDEARNFIEIPISLEIEVTIFSPEEESKKSDLVQRTKCLLKDFETAKIQTISKTTTDLSAITRKGFEREGVEFEEIYAEIGERTTSLLDGEPVDAGYIEMRTNPPHDANNDDVYAEIKSVKPSLPPPEDSKTKTKPLPLPSQKPKSRKLPGRFHTIGRTSEKNKLKLPPRLSSQKEKVERKLSVDSAAQQSVKSKYQPLHRPSLSIDSYYVDLCPTRHSEVSPTSSSMAIPPEQGPPSVELVNNLVSRIQSLEMQVATLNDKVDRLMNR